MGKALQPPQGRLVAKGRGEYDPGRQLVHQTALAGNAEFGGKIAADVGDDLYLCRLCLHVHGLSSCVFANL